MNRLLMAGIFAATISPSLADSIGTSSSCSEATQSDAGKRAIAASAVANCRLHPSRTIREAADAVYRSVRDIHIQLGIVK